VTSTVRGSQNDRWPTALTCSQAFATTVVGSSSTPSNPSDLRLIVANGQRKVGTDLRNITAKLSPAYINTWIWAPKAFRPSTKMPHFFMLENNSSDEELRRTRQEALSITEYFAATADPLEPPHPISPSMKGAGRGKLISPDRLHGVSREPE
jgi:hypothetical protein